MIKATDVKVRYVRHLHTNHPFAALGLVKNELTGTYNVSLAICHKSDQFNKKVATAIVTGRLLMNLNNKRMNNIFYGQTIEDIITKIEAFFVTKKISRTLEEQYAILATLKEMGKN